jgi:glycosyltransferase involved in cell wall biosynthesis
LVGGEDSGGILIPLDDAPALAAALRRIFESPALAAKFSARSLELARSTFSMPAIGSRLRAFLLR